MSSLVDTVHLDRGRLHAPPIPACNTAATVRLTNNPTEVTCRMCMRTRAYRKATVGTVTVTLVDLDDAKPGDFTVCRIKSVLATRISPVVHVAEVLDRESQRTLTVRPICGTPRRGVARKPNDTSTPCVRCRYIAPTRGIDLTGADPS